MAAVYPDRTIASNGFATLTGAATHHAALDASTASYVTMIDPPAFCDVGLATPSGLSTPFKWVRGYLVCEAQTPAAFVPTPRVRCTLAQQPSIDMRIVAGIGAWSEVSEAGFDVSRYLTGPATLFTGGTFRLSSLDTAGGANVDANDFRFEIVDYIDPPTASIVGPTGTVDVVDGVYVPAQWSFSSPAGFPYAGWRLRVCTAADGTGVIYTASGSSGLTHNIPASVLAPYLASALFVRVAVANTVGGSYIGPDPATGKTQFGDYAQATFTPVGAVSATFQAVRPVAWVDALSESKRSQLSLFHAPQVEAVLFDHYGLNRWPLEVLDGSVTIDANSQKRTRFSMTVAKSELMPTTRYPKDSGRPLHPDGPYVQIARGVGGELVALCAGVIETVAADLTIAGRSPVSVNGFDWSLWLSDARFTYNRMRHTFSGTYTSDLVTDALVDIVNEAGLTSLLLGSSASLVQPSYLNKVTDDRSAALDSLTESIGWWWYADTLGRIVFGLIPSTTATPLYTLTEGPDCKVERHTLTLSRTDTFDLAVAYNDTGQFIAGAFDQNPQSPILRGAGDPDTPTVGAGEFSPGGKPFFFSSPIITSLGTAQTTARTILERKAIPAERITLSAVPMPDLRPGHMIELARAGDSARRWQVEAVTIPLSIEGRMSINAFIPADYVDAVN